MGPAPGHRRGTGYVLDAPRAKLVVRGGGFSGGPSSVHKGAGGHWESGWHELHMSDGGQHKVGACIVVFSFGGRATWVRRPCATVAD